MTMIRYQHVERIDSDNISGLLEGTCHIYPKMDGSNMCAYLEDGKVRTMSRNRVIEAPEPFASFVGENPKIGEFLRGFPGLRLYGEWMVPHTIRSYIGETWNRWFVFDVTAEDSEAVYEYELDGERRILEMAGRTYIPYEEYEPILRSYGIDCIPPIAIVENPTVEELERMADNDATFMMSEGSGEGIVVKRYDFVNKFGRTEWAKLINTEYSRKRIVRCNRGEGTVERDITDRYVTPDLVSKECAKIVEITGTDQNIQGRLLSTVYHCLVTEFMWDAVKRYGNPTVNFKTLRRECDIAVKEARPEIFGLRLA